MSKVVAVVNQKGGVAKTTSSINLAAAFARLGKRVLLIDIDPQGNATSGSGVDAVATSIYPLLLGEAEASEVIVKTNHGYDMMPAANDLSGAQVELVAEIDRDYRLKSALETISDNYDFIFIDCPPSLNLLTVNALVAANSVLIPLQCEFFALEGMSQLVKTIDKVQQHLNPRLSIEGLLRTMYDGRTSLTREVNDQLVEFFGDQLYRTVIPRNVRLAEAPGHGLPAIQYDPASSGAQAYLALANEMLKRNL
ncbi:ParA family protein [Gammaproteobacteria bacterium]|nr:ParA family protein [Gammaproteobacteria bacterium]